MFDKLMGGFKKKADVNHTSSLEMYKKKLGGLVYDDELINELAPIFAKLHSVEGFDKVFELLESKERQIEAIAGGEWTEQQHEHTQQEEEESHEEQGDYLTAEQILAQRHNIK